MANQDVYLLAIETSCDETSLAIVKNGNEVIEQITNTQIDTFKELGGVVPEMASRMHADNIFYVYEELLRTCEFDINNIDAICVTQGPGLIGSLLVGVNFAKTLAMQLNKPLIAVNHMEAHIYACNLEGKMKFPHLSLIVSGGHTELIYLEENMSFKKVGKTLDDAVGECYDKVSRLLGLSYPGGPVIDKLAQVGESVYDLPYPKDDNTLDFSFSGIKSACFNLHNSMQMKNIEISKEDFAATFQEKVMTVLLKKLKHAEEMYKPIQMSIVGGVSGNSQIQKLKSNNILIPSLKYTSDNAAMIGALGYEKYLKGQFIKPELLDANVSLEINEDKNK